MSDEHRYLIALGSNMRHVRHGAPGNVLRAAFDALAKAPFVLRAAAPIVGSAPVGPSQRRYANSAAIVATRLDPPAALDALQAIENAFGRTRRGERWRARVLDLDIIAWSGGTWSDARLTIPHPRFRQRSFVLTPAAAIAADWRDPISGLTLAQQSFRNMARKRVDRPAAPA